MAKENEKTQVLTPSAAPPAPPTTASSLEPEKAPTLEDLRKKVLKRTKSAEAKDRRPPDPSLAGEYKVTHGTVHFGHGVRAEAGSIVSLTAGEAEHMLGCGVVESTKPKPPPEFVDDDADED